MARRVLLRASDDTSRDRIPRVWAWCGATEVREVAEFQYEHVHLKAGRVDQPRRPTEHAARQAATGSMDEWRSRVRGGARVAGAEGCDKAARGFRPGGVQRRPQLPAKPEAPDRFVTDFHPRRSDTCFSCRYLSSQSTFFETRCGFPAFRPSAVVEHKVPLVSAGTEP